MPFGNTFSLSRYAAGVKPIGVEARRTTKEEFLPDMQQFISPEVVRIENVSAVNLSSDSAGQVLDCFAREASIDGCKVPVSFCVSFLE
jgi:hypothetical protein